MPRPDSQDSASHSPIPLVLELAQARDVAIATLIAVCQDKSVSAADRVNAADKILTALVEAAK